MKISVVGCGYLGAVHAACMAELGHDVLGIDVDETKVAALSAGRAPFYEPGFEELLTRVLGTGRLRFTGNRKAEPTTSPWTRSPWFRHDRLADARRSAQPASTPTSRLSRAARNKRPESKPPHTR